MVITTALTMQTRGTKRRYDTTGPYIPGVAEGERYRKRFAYAPRINPAFSLAQPGRQAITYKRQFINTPETKYFDCGFNNQMTSDGTAWTATEVPMDNFIDTSGTIAAYTDKCLIPTASGTGYGQIIGGKYKLKRIRIRGHFRIDTITDQADSPEPNFIRLILVLDRQPNKAQAQGEVVMQDYGTAENNLHSFMNVIGNTGRFQILKDKNYVIHADSSFNDAAATASVGFNGMNFKMGWSPQVPEIVNFVSGSATPNVAQCVSHNIFMLCMGIRAGAAAGLKIAGTSRCYYCE